MSDTIISNRERQEDEVIALSNIYDENEFFCTRGKQIKCTVSIFPHFPEKLEVNFANYTSFNATSDIAFNDKIFIEYLPPIKFYISLPDSYPSQKPPKFFFSVTWLPLWEISFVCQKLDEMWEENKNSEILFLWISFLKNDILDFLGIQTILDVSFMHTIYTESDNFVTTFLDPRAINGALSLNIKKLLMHFDKEQHLTQFNKKDIICGICFVKYKGLKCIELSNCGHIYCKSCMQEYIRIKLSEYVKIISCPTLDCNCKLNVNDIKTLCPSIFSQYEELMVRVALDTMDDIIYCPQISCQYPVIRDQSDTAPICPNCNYCFCIYCRKIYHGNAPCEMTSDHIKELVNEYEKSDDKRKKLLEKKYGRRQMQLVEKHLTTEYLKDNAKTCPKCHTLISKIDGCNKMMCQHCQSYFCWLCGDHITSINAYEHFTDVNNSCFGRLFENVDENDNDIDNIIRNIIWFEPGVLN